MIVTLETDPETGELVLPIPQEILDELGWQLGDIISFTQNDDKISWQLTKRN